MLRKFLLKWLAAPFPHIWSPLGRVILLLVGVVLPVACFAMSTSGVPRIGSLWQDGSLSTYATLIPSIPCVLPFYPLLGYCMVCMTLLVINHRRFQSVFVIRFGIYTGILLAIQFHAIVFPPNSVWLLAINVIGSLLLCALLIAVVIAVLWGLTLLVKQFVPSAAGALGVVLAVLGVSVIVVFEPRHIFIGVWLGTLALATSFAFTAYAAVSAYLWTLPLKPRFRLSTLLAVFTWIAGYFAAWRTSVDLVLQAYAKLPVDHDNCYVCTAAARGHRLVVGAVEVTTPGGAHLLANDQMRILKALELTLGCTWPYLHRQIRACYDRVGPRLASRITSPWRADIAYLALKLFEWPSRWCLRALGIPGKTIHDLYGTDKETLINPSTLEPENREVAARTTPDISPRLSRKEWL